MRITNSMMVQTMIRNLNRNMVRLNDKQIQFSTGKRINKPSDDPLGISKSLRLRTDIAVMEQYRRNVDDASSFMDNTETALQNMLEGMQRIRELTVQAANGTLTGEETAKMQAEIGEIKNQLIDLANYTYSGKHIFSGKKTGEPLLDREGNYLIDLTKAADPRMVDDKWAFEVSTRETIQVNTLGFEVFEAEVREVVYTDLETIPARLELPLINSSDSFVLNFEAGAAAPWKDAATGEWNVGVSWQGSFLETVNRALENIQEIVGPQLGEYIFTVENKDEFNSSTNAILNRTYLKAVPKDAAIEDNYQATAVWRSGVVGSPDFSSVETQRLTFNGVEIILVEGDLDAAPGLEWPNPPAEKNSVTITVNGGAAVTPGDYVNVLNAMAAQRGSEVFGFSFSPDGTGGIQAAAPERSGSQHNKAYFGGTISIATPRDQQLVVTGTSPTRYVEAGQKAGLFVMLDKLKAGLETGRQDDVSNLLGSLDAHINTILTVRSETGAKANRMDLITNRIEDDTLNFRNLMSKIEDADMSKVIIELMNEENVYRSALGVGARIIQPTLLDFLR